MDGHSLSRDIDEGLRAMGCLILGLFLAVILLMVLLMWSWFGPEVKVDMDIDVQWEEEHHGKLAVQ